MRKCLRLTGYTRKRSRWKLVQLVVECHMRRDIFPFLSLLPVFLVQTNLVTSGLALLALYVLIVPPPRVGMFI